VALLGCFRTASEAMGFEPTPALKAICTKCLDCFGGSAAEVADCLVKNCALYPFRMGKNPGGRTCRKHSERRRVGTPLRSPSP
jgi:hypothetical protein